MSDKTILAPVNITNRGGWIRVALYRCEDLYDHSTYFETIATKTGEPLTWGESKEEAINDIAMKVRQAIEFDNDTDLLNLVEFS